MRVSNISNRSTLNFPYYVLFKQYYVTFDDRFSDQQCLKDLQTLCAIAKANAERQIGVHVLFIIYKIVYLQHFTSFLSFGRPYTILHNIIFVLF